MIINFSPFPVLKTKRLLLRQIRLDDSNEIYEMRSNPLMHLYTDSLVDNCIEDTSKYIANMNKGVEANKWIIWAIEENVTKKVIGTISIWNLNLAEKKGELGFGIIPDFQNLGLMTEALQAVSYYGFIDLGLNSIEAYTEETNLKARKLLEKNNYKQIVIHQEEGYSVNKTFNMIIYSLNR